MKAVVTGGTGAIGSCLVDELLASPKWSSVTTIGRKPWSPSLSSVATKIDIDTKLTHVQLDMEALAASTAKGVDGTANILPTNVTAAVAAAAAACQGANAAFCTLGTTHADAGGAEGFRRVDRWMVEAHVAAASAAKVPYFAHVTSAGGSFAFLSNYGRTKVHAENAIRAAAFPASAVLQPGLLDRGASKMRGAEKIFAAIVSSTPVSKVARAMRLDAEAALCGGMGGRKGLRVISDAEIRALA
jgi:uncharacterized protein YbjT (DUF2867 family)